MEQEIEFDERGRERLRVILHHLHDEALRLVNRYRMRQGWPELYEFPRGRMANSRACPLALALRSNSVGGTIMVEDVETAKAVFGTEEETPGRSVVTPFALLEFWRAHDSGFYPDLILGYDEKIPEDQV